MIICYVARQMEAPNDHLWNICRVEDYPTVPHHILVLMSYGHKAELAMKMVCELNDELRFKVERKG